MEEIAVKLADSIGVTAGSTQKRTLDWTHSNPSTKTLEKISLRFTMSSVSTQGYSVRVTETISQGSFSDRLTAAAAATAGSQHELDLSSAAWTGKTAGTLTASFMCRGSFNTFYNDVYMVFYYQAIASASTITVTPAEAGQPQTVNITNTDAGVYHKVRWEYAGNVDSGWQTYGAATRNPGWAVPAANIADLFTANPNSATETGTVSVQTYTADGSLVGTTTADAVLYLPENATTRPQMGTETVSDVPDAVAQTIGSSYVQNHTLLKRRITATGYQGATIVEIRLVTPDGTASASYGSDAEMMIRTSGSYAVQLQAVDSRGFIGTYDAGTLTVLAYADPAISSIQAMRCDQNGNARDDGGYVWVEAAATGSETPITYTGTVRAKNSQTVIDTDTLTNGAGILGGNLDEDTSYVITVTAADNYGVEAEAVIEIGTATVTLSRMAGGKGIAFGKRAERFGVEVNEAWPFRVHGAEILRLIMDLAHPVGSVIESADASWDPNTAWPWTRWALTGGKWVRGV